MEGTFGGLEEELEKKLQIVDEDGGSGSDSDSGEEDEEFEFAFVCRDPDTDEITADELFSNGQIRTAFPLFNRDLLLSDDAGAASASESADSADGGIMLPLRKLLVEDGGVSGGGGEEGAYCVWTPRSPAVPPSPGQCKKSRSTGSSSRRWRLRDLLHRSSSDGKETFVFLSAPATAVKASASPAVAENEKGKIVNSHDGPKKKKGKKGTRPVSAHEIYLRKRAGAVGHRYELPYRTGIMGFFSNA